MRKKNPFVDIKQDAAIGKASVISESWQVGIRHYILPASVEVKSNSCSGSILAVSLWESMRHHWKYNPISQSLSVFLVSHVTNSGYHLDFSLAHHIEEHFQ